MTKRTVQCRHCRAVFYTERPNARYCSPRCRAAQARAERRKDAEAEQRQAAGEAPAPAPAPALSLVRGADQAPAPNPGLEVPGLVQDLEIKHGAVYLSTKKDLTEAGVLDTPDAAIALILSDRIDRSLTETGSALAAVVTAHTKAVARAMERKKGAEGDGDALDGLRALADRIAAMSDPVPTGNTEDPEDPEDPEDSEDSEATP